MIKTISIYDFRNEFENSSRKGQFSYEALEAIFNYLEELEVGTDQQIELDVIGICSEFTEYPNLDAVKKEYSNIETLQDLQDRTAVLELEDGGLVISNF